MKNETKAKKIIQAEIEKYSILKPTSMAQDIIEALLQANLISSNLPVSSSKPTVKDGITTYPDGSRYNERGQGICNTCDRCYEFIRSCDTCGYTDGKHW